MHVRPAPKDFTRITQIEILGLLDYDLQDQREYAYAQ